MPSNPLLVSFLLFLVCAFLCYIMGAGTSRTQSDARFAVDDFFGFLLSVMAIVAVIWWLWDAG